jgi:hypothetical protein
MKRRKKVTKKKVYQTAMITVALILIVLAFSYWLNTTEWYQPKINELSASYISLNNNNTTDMLKITNLHKLSTRKGKKNSNPCKQNIEITGDSNQTYQIVLYHLGYILEDQYVYYQLTSDEATEITGNLSNAEDSYDGGKIIFEGNLKDGKNWKLKMWVNKKYPGEVKNIAYEIRIKEAGE